jgi:hypothetical protein
MLRQAYRLTVPSRPGRSGRPTPGVERWWDRAILRFQTNYFWLLGAMMDDLVLDAAVMEVVPLIPEGSS